MSNPCRSPAEVVVLVEIVLAIPFLPQRVRGPVRPVAVAGLFVAGGVIFGHEPFIGVEEAGAFAGNLLPQAPPEGVVIIGRNDVAVGVIHLDQSILGFVMVREHHRAIQYELGGVAVLVICLFRVGQGLDLVILVIILSQTQQPANLKRKDDSNSHHPQN